MKKKSKSTKARYAIKHTAASGKVVEMRCAKEVPLNLILKTCRAMTSHTGSKAVCVRIEADGTRIEVES